MCTLHYPSYPWWPLHSLISIWTLSVLSPFALAYAPVFSPFVSFHTLYLFTFHTSLCTLLTLHAFNPSCLFTLFTLHVLFTSHIFSPFTFHLLTFSPFHPSCLFTLCTFLPFTTDTSMLPLRSVNHKCCKYTNTPLYTPTTLGLQSLVQRVRKLVWSVQRMQRRSKLCFLAPHHLLVENSKQVNL